MALCSTVMSFLAENQKSDFWVLARNDIVAHMRPLPSIPSASDGFWQQWAIANYHQVSGNLTNVQNSEGNTENK